MISDLDGSLGSRYFLNVRHVLQRARERLKVTSVFVAFE